MKLCLGKYTCALTLGALTLATQAAGQTDPLHSHKQDEFFIITDGSLWLEDVESANGSVIFIPRNTEYAVRAGENGARYFRVVA